VLPEEGLKADTQKGYLNIVMSVLKHAYENDVLNKLPKRLKLQITYNLNRPGFAGGSTL